MGDFEQGLWGKTVQVKLADGNTYTMREPSIMALKDNKIGTDLTDYDNVCKLVHVLLKEDQKDVTLDRAGRLVTFSMLRENSEFIKALYELLGLSKNAEAR